MSLTYRRGDAVQKLGVVRYHAGCPVARPYANYDHIPCMLFWGNRCHV